jgi:hypothetical protein
LTGKNDDVGSQAYKLIDVQLIFMEVMFMPDYSQITRKYSKDDLDMLQQAQVFHDNFVIDKADFIAAFTMFADPFETDFQTDIDAADAIPLDSEVAQAIAIITEEIETEMAKGRTAMQKLFTYAKVGFDDSQASLKAFGKGEYEKSRSNQLKLKEMLEKAHRQASEAANKAILLGAGYSQTDIDNLDTIMTDIDTKDASQEDAKSDRLKKTEDRVIAYNKVWEYLEKISEASKVIYVDSPAKLQQYVLYPSSSTLPGKVQNMGYDYGTNTVSWDAAPNADTYQLERKYYTDPEWTVVYEGADTSVVDVPPGSGTWLYRCRGQNGEGYGSWSDELMVIMPVTP